ncbi:MBL fold metallo-hydrolase [Truepera radiovictrix]|uniref:Beta-lactamase-like protein n=1 Tax=Truepera radiovictrix (strain DSM 17093 / CIP 108686 / LMG 22925 / RQ-24) TaxID=649638 RepID=D7CUD4_TRURR|nr:MBL fold metallo-hydrolase [Truepera radiovictrix]ADI15719.1 beta-lactamase-like protein [Truepera radiovictrix DSM 17093]WMT58655.1 MBL fold metallo-hydrolase [Truepera radiovictrix]
MPSGPTLRFLGAADSQGVPRWWCACSVCRDARGGGVNARTRPSVLIEGPERVLIDAAPELRLQASREGLTGFSAALITHAHNDHVLGLGDLADWSRWTGARCPIYAPREVMEALAARFPYLQTASYRARTPLLALEDAACSRTFAGYRVSALRVPHGFNGFAYGFRFEGPGGAWGYLPDCLDLADLAPWRGLKLLVLGASFFREAAPKAGRSVYDVQEALALLAELKPKRALLTHLGHGVDARQGAPDGVQYARDGLVVPLP